MDDWLHKEAWLSLAHHQADTLFLWSTSHEDAIEMRQPDDY